MKAQVQVRYGDRRRAKYPAVEDQLDALWHAMDAGILPMVPAFYDPIAAAKTAHPKPAIKPGKKP